MIIDTHVHIGQFYGEYYDPETVSKQLKKCGVDYYAASSTTMCEENYNKALSEIRRLIELDAEKICPILWITPNLLQDTASLDKFLNGDIKWRCVKIHPLLHPNDWNSDGKQIKEVIAITRELNVPLLIHTGIDPSCQAGKFEKEFASNPEVPFIMAHGRPLNEAMTMLTRYPNTLTDTAFMPADDVVELKNQGFIDRILFGSDYPINCHFSQVTQGYPFISECITALKARLTPEEFDKIMYINALKVYKCGVADGQSTHEDKR